MEKLKEQQNNEVDIIQLIIRVIRFTTKHRLLFLILTVGGLIYGFFKHMSDAKSAITLYSYQSLAHSDVVSDEFVVDIINGMPRLLNTEQIPSLAVKMGISKEKAMTIRSISAAAISSNIRDHSRFSVSFTLSDSSAYDDVMKGIQNYVYAQPYIKDRVELFRSEKSRLIGEMKASLAMSYTVKDKDRYVPIGVKSTTAELYTNRIADDLNNRIVQTEVEVKMAREFNYIESGTPPSISSSVTGRNKTLSLYGIGGFLLGIFIGLLLEVKTLVAEKW